MTEQTPTPPSYDAPPAPPAVPGQAPIGKVRSTGLCFLWTILTLGIYTYFWMGFTHGELKRHTGTGLGGALAVVIWLFVSPVMFFLTPNEIGNMQEATGRPRTLSALWGLWFLLPLIGPIVWFVKVNGTLNEYWESLGAA
jgi:hypothetical protein